MASEPIKKGGTLPLNTFNTDKDIYAWPWGYDHPVPPASLQEYPKGRGVYVDYFIRTPEGWVRT